MENREMNETEGLLMRKTNERSKYETRKRVMEKSIENGRETGYHFERVLNLDYCLLLFSIANIMLMIFYYDADYSGKSTIANFCLYFTTALLLFEILVTIFRYRVQLELEKAQMILDGEETIHSSGKSVTLGMELVILLLQPYPFLNQIQTQTWNIYDGFNFPFKINYILVFFGFLKLFIVIRVVLLRQIYMSPRSSRLCRMYGCQSDYLYAIKCLFKDSPMSLIGIVFAFSILIFAICLRIAERELAVYYPLNNNGATNPQDLASFENALWLTIITMTTVGYGDFYPRTLFGRIIDVILVVWGTFVVSLMVVVLTNTLNMDQSEKRALIVLNRLEAKKSLKESAAYLITHSCKRYLIRKRILNNQRPPLTQEEHAKLENSFYNYLTNFQNVHRVIRSMYEIDDVYEEMTRQFEFINDEINFLLNSQEETITNLKNYLDQDHNKMENTF